MCLLARAKRQQNLRRTGSVGRKVSEPYASKSKRQQNKRSRYNRTSGKLMRYSVKSNPILWPVEALRSWKVPKQLAVECPRCLSLQPGCCGAQPGPGLSFSPALGLCRQREWWLLPSSGCGLAAAGAGLSPRALQGRPWLSTVVWAAGLSPRCSASAWCVFCWSVGSKNHQPPLLPRGAVCADGGRGQLQHHVPLYGVARCSWAEVPELPTYSCWFPLPLLLTFIILLISSAESKFVRSRFQKASKCQFW